MKKRIGMAVFVLFLVPGLLFTAGCSKKQVKPDETVPAIETGQGQGSGLSAEEEARRRALEEQRLAEERRRQQEAGARAAFGENDIYFDFDDSTLTPTAQAVLREKAAFMNAYPEIEVIIEGHCDERGTNEYNMALGERRAESAKRFLMNLGISGSRMTTISYGEEKPAALGHDEESWARNRRAHFEIR